MISGSNFGRCIAVLVIGYSVATAVQAASLVSHYEFEGNGNNSVGGAPNGTTVGTATIGPPGRIGNEAISFDGSAGLFDTTTSGEPTPAGAQAGTVALWFKNNQGASTGSKYFLGTLNANDSTAVQFGTNGVGGLEFFIRGAAGGSLQVADGGGAQDIFNPDLSYADGQWHHIAFTWSIDPTTSANNHANLYLDGQPLDPVFRANSASGATPLSAYENPVWIGTRNNRGAASGIIEGMLDDVRIYDMPLSLAEIQSLPGVIPEPTSIALCFAGALAAVSVRRRADA